MKHYNFSGVLVTVFDNKSTLVTGKHQDWMLADTLVEPAEAFDGTGIISDLDYHLRWIERMIKDGKTIINTLWVSGLITLLGCIFVVGRLYVRKVVLRRLYVDDWFIFAALITGLISYALFLKMGLTNLPHLIWYNSHPLFSNKDPPIPITDYDLAFLLQNLFYIFVNAQAATARLSILYTFSRLSVQRQLRLYYIRIFIHAFAVSLTLACIATTWLAADPCWPPSALKRKTDSTCLPMSDYTSITTVVFLATAAFNSFADLICFALPFIIFRLTVIAIKPEQMRGLYGLFGFGFFVFLISMFRFLDTYLYERQFLRYKSVPSPTETLLTWATAESNAVMIGASLPVIARPVWRWASRRFKKQNIGGPSASCQTDGAGTVNRNALPLYSEAPENPGVDFNPDHKGADSEAKVVKA